MGTQQQVQQPSASQGRKRFSRKTLLIIIVVIAALVIAAAWLLSSLGKLPGIWATIISIVVTLIGVIASLWPYLVSSGKNEAVTITNAPSTVPPVYQPQIIVQVPPTPPTPQPMPTPQPDKALYRGIVSLPPPTDTKTIQQREKAVREVYDKLIQPDITAIVLTGIGGAGKSTLAALVYNYAEEQRRTRKGPFTAEPLWLRVDPSVTMADLTGNLVEALGKPLPDLSSFSPENQAAALFNALNTVDKPHLVILDQFENLLDWKTGHALLDRPGIGEWLDAINSQQCTCHILLTSRPFPQGTRDYPPTLMQEYAVGGLEEAEAMELLRKQGVKGTEAELRIAIDRCSGHALSLTLLATLMRTRNLSMTTLLKDPIYTRLWSGNIARNLLESIYSQQLDELQRKLLQAFSGYREPMPLDAALAITNSNPAIPRAQAESALDGLLAQHLLQASGEGRYQLHLIVATYVQDHFVDGDEQANQQALRVAHEKAAQYYQRQAATNCPPREKRRQISDVHDLIEAIWQYCQAEQWQEAYDLMEEEGVFNDLKRWGGNAVLLELYQLLLSDKWQPERLQEEDIYYELGWIYHDLGRKQEALLYYEQALQICREVGDRSREGNALNNLGSVYDDLGQKQEALKYYEQALQILREVGYREGEGRILNNLGEVYRTIGQNLEALHYYEQALQIGREVGDRWGEGATLDNLGLVYEALGQQRKALGYHKQALQIFREIGYPSDEGKTLWNIGTLYFQQNHYDVALACFLLARGIYEEVQSPDRDEVQSWIDRLREEIGEKQFAASLARVEPQAHQIVERALREGL